MPYTTAPYSYMNVNLIPIYMKLITSLKLSRSALHA